MSPQIESLNRLRLSEVMNPAELFGFAHFSHRKWQQDRPLMDRFNHSGLDVSLSLLSGEIDELNGGDETGIFSKDNIQRDHVLREDYRQQEVADIIIFLMTTFDEMGETIDIDSLYSSAEFLVDGYGFDLATSDLDTFPPQALETDQNDIYGELKNGLNVHADIVSQYDVETGARDQLIHALEGILVYCIAMHSLMGVNSARAVLEKIERNHIKYPKDRFQISEDEEQITFEELRDLYNLRRGECADEFDGKKDHTSGERPKTGTRHFYEVIKPMVGADIKEKEEQGELFVNRDVGLLHITMARVMGSFFGFTAKVSDLYKHNIT